VATFGELLRQHRRAARLTQEELAERAGLSVHGVQKIERGATHPYRETAQRLLQALQLPPEELARFTAAIKPVRRHPKPDQPARISPEPLRGQLHNVPLQQTAFPGMPARPQSGGSLPAQPNSLIGREREQEELSRQLRRPEVRLLTLTGPGGVGKTRLAVAVAERLREVFTDGAWFVDLSSLRDPAFVLPTIAQRLGLRSTGSRRDLDLVADYLRGRQLLLVLDNCEQVLDCVEDFAPF